MASWTTIVFLGSSLLYVALGQQISANGCYREYTNSKVNCLLSFTQKAVNSVEDCEAFCTQQAPKCKAAQMSPAPEGMCQLFDTALTVNAAGRRRRAAGCYGYGPSVITGQGYCYLLPNNYGCQGGGVQTTMSAVQSEPTTQPTVATPPTQAPVTDAPTVPTDAPTVPTVPTVPSDPTTTLSTVTDGPLPPEVTCPAGKVVRYTYVEGYQLSGQPDASFQAASEQDCLTACTNNRSPDGKQVACRSADYNAQSQQCSISVLVTPPLGETKADPNADSKHFEKVCVNDTIGQNCPGSYYRSPQHILIGFAQAVTTASSTAECLEYCATSQTRFQFACSSGMFYFDETSNNCILNSETRIDHPDLFVTEETDGVEYFEPGCAATRRLRQATTSTKRNRNILQMNTGAFGGWSMCDKVQLNHMRFKQCTGLNPNRCQLDSNACDPAKEAQYDLEVNATSPVGPVRDRQPPKGELNKKKPSPHPHWKLPPTTPKGAARATTPPPNKKATAKGTTPKAPTTPKPTTPKPTSPPPKPSSDCVSIIGNDGRRDCQVGLRLMPNGKRQPCVPDRKACESDRQRDKKGRR